MHLQYFLNVGSYLQAYTIGSQAYTISRLSVIGYVLNSWCIAKGSKGKKEVISCSGILKLVRCFEEMVIWRFVHEVQGPTWQRIAKQIVLQIALKDMKVGLFIEISGAHEARKMLLRSK